MLILVKSVSNTLGRSFSGQNRGNNEALFNLNRRTPVPKPSLINSSQSFHSRGSDGTTPIPREDIHFRMLVDIFSVVINLSISIFTS